MNNKIVNNLSVSQKQVNKINPIHLQTVKLLKYSEEEILEVIEKELDENPALEKDEKDSLDKLADLNSTYSHHRQNDNLYYEIEQKSVFKGTWYQNLQIQIDFLNVSQREKDILFFIAGNIDSDGFFRKDLGLVLNDLKFLLNIKTDVIELERLLKLIQSLDPIGIGARDAKEYLVLKINKSQENSFIKQLAIDLVLHYNNFLIKNNIQEYAKKIKNCNLEDVKLAFKMIKSLSFKPIEEDELYVKNKTITPDFVVVIENGMPKAKFFNDYEIKIRVSAQYISIIKNSRKNNEIDNEAFLFAKKEVDKAFFFIGALNQRKRNLKAIVDALVSLQEKFFLSGNEKDIKPLKMKQIAKRAEVDVSTVSRVVCGKYVKTDFGNYPMKYFFSSSLIASDGNEVSNIEVKQKILEIISKEDKNKPYSDEEISKLLKEHGYKIARRTVAKYRSMLNIPTSLMRG